MFFSKTGKLCMTKVHIFGVQWWMLNSQESCWQYGKSWMNMLIFVYRSIILKMNYQHPLGWQILTLDLESQTEKIIEEEGRWLNRLLKN